ncbi:hypothetical protein DXG01_002844, partial [Tephrocybe rancida]
AQGRAYKYAFPVWSIPAELIINAEYMKNLGKSTVFKGHILGHCLLWSHMDIVKVWNFRDPEQMALCLEVYLVNLTLILYEHFITSLKEQQQQPLTSELLLETLNCYKESRSKGVHRRIRNSIPKSTWEAFFAWSNKENIRDLVRLELSRSGEGEGEGEEEDLALKRDDTIRYRKLKKSLKKCQVKAATFQSVKLKVAKSDPGCLKALHQIYEEIQSI